MFKQVEIALVFNGMALATDGKEYEIIKNTNPDCLVIDQLLTQLKISNIEYGYFFNEGQLTYLKFVPIDLELMDLTCRFKFSQSTILNSKDIYMVNRLFSHITKTDSLATVFVKWGKKSECFFDFDGAKNERVDLSQQFEKVLNELPDKIILNQRFSVLLNATFLDKLKTYCALWRQKHQVSYTIPDWYNSLYPLQKNNS